ncbi:hypothetical protein TRAPUB_12055 [Trametes pubescens]|uniref:Uncharacterized protein n=1 Tax=Trametes pubescens TaxID=154538 RepID=A0A1M2VUZ7_TRAPU|nr:hypothetical protein TRAPUB_12055 [Trametes pubescens]
MDLPDDIGQLSALAAALHAIRSDCRSDLGRLPSLGWPNGKRLDSVGAAALDALATLAISACNQAYALGAVLDGHGGNLELYIAGNTEEVPPAAVAHLNDICARLLSIHAAIEASPNRSAVLDKIRWDSHIPSGSPEPAITALRDPTATTGVPAGYHAQNTRRDADRRVDVPRLSQCS